MIETELDTERFGFIGGHLSLDFTNTISNYVFDRSNERFFSYADVVDWAKAAGVLNAEEASRMLLLAAKRPNEADRVFEEAVALREALHFIFSAQAADKAPRKEDVATLNVALGTAMCHAKLVNSNGGFEWGWESKSDHLDSVLWPVARSAADLLTSGDVQRVQECAGNTCGWLFLDMSRNHSRHWCDMKDCGNRAKARRHYHRKQKTTADSG